MCVCMWWWGFLDNGSVVYLFHHCSFVTCLLVALTDHSLYTETASDTFVQFSFTHFHSLTFSHHPLYLGHTSATAIFFLLVRMLFVCPCCNQFCVCLVLLWMCLRHMVPNLARSCIIYFTFTDTLVLTDLILPVQYPLTHSFFLVTAATAKTVGKYPAIKLCCSPREMSSVSSIIQL